MTDSLPALLKEIETLAGYNGPWRKLREEAPRVRERAAELRAREQRLDDVLMVALIGGSGVGKSTLLNALAGDALAKTSEMRPCTSSPTVYHPPGVLRAFPGWETVSGSALEHLVLIDTPDTDTIVLEHRERVREVLAECDLLLLCGSEEKYLDEATIALLRPLRRERAIVCIETKAEGAGRIREHWEARLREQDLRIEGYFRVNALRAFERKLRGGAPAADEAEFPALESFLRDALTRERIVRIKRSNAFGLLAKTAVSLRDCAAAAGPEFEALEERLDALDDGLALAASDEVERRLFTEPHLWRYAVAHETAVRARGLVGGLYRVLSAVSSLPVHMRSMLPWGRRSAGRQAAAALTGGGLIGEAFAMDSPALEQEWEEARAAAALAFQQAGFDPLPPGAESVDFLDALSQGILQVLGGEAREAVQRAARRVSDWRLALVMDALPAGLILYCTYLIVSTFIQGEIHDTGFFVHAGMVFALLAGFLIALLSGAVRFGARHARRRALEAFQLRIATARLGFPAERAALAEARREVARIQSLASSVLQ